MISTAREPGCIVRVWVNRRPPQQRETVALLPGYGARGGTADLCLSAVPGAAFPAPAVLIEQYTSQVAKLSPGHTLTHAAEIIVAGQPAVLLAYTCDGSTDAQVGEISVCFPADAAIFQFEYMGPLTAIADLHDPLWSILRSFRPVAFAAAGTGKGLTEKGVRAARRPTRNSSRDRS